LELMVGQLSPMVSRDGKLLSWEERVDEASRRFASSDLCEAEVQRALDTAVWVRGDNRGSERGVASVGWAGTRCFL
jgi:hypothetical protein